MSSPWVTAPPGSDQLQPGDVLVAPFTGPSVKSLLPVIGALVVEEGGALCHSAIVAREFGLAAVIGAHRATSRILHGAQVEVDPAHGTASSDASTRSTLGRGPGLHPQSST